MSQPEYAIIVPAYQAADLADTVAGLTADEALLGFVARNTRPELKRQDLAKEEEEQNRRTAPGLKILHDPDQAEALDRLLAAIRYKVLRDRFKLDVDWISAKVTYPDGTAAAVSEAATRRLEAAIREIDREHRQKYQRKHRDEVYRRGGKIPYDRAQV